MNCLSRRAYIQGALVAAVATPGCVSRLVDGGPNIPETAFPPGTDRTGFVDRDALFDAHEERLRTTSFTYQEGYDPVGTEPAYTATGRQTAGGRSGGRRFHLTAELSVPEAEAGYRLDGRRVPDCWRSASMPGHRTYRRIETDVSVSAPTRFNETSQYAEQFPPGQRTWYEMTERSLLREHRRAFVQNLTLRNLTVSPIEQNSHSGTSGVTFSITGTAAQSPRPDSFVRSGSVEIDTTGLIRSLSVSLSPSEDEQTRVETSFSELGTTSVGPRPDWVYRQFASA